MTDKEISVSELVLNLLKSARKGGVSINDERKSDDIYYPEVEYDNGSADIPPGKPSSA